jgi:hypothetical protein
MDRLRDITRFYTWLDARSAQLGGPRRLDQCHGRQGWPERGVYFFFEPGQMRADSGTGPRVVRVGTHALNEGSRTSLWGRLSQHRGIARDKGGNHRGSIFRALVGAALQGKGGLQPAPSWGHKQSLGDAARDLGQPVETLRELERPIEMAVSAHIGAMSFIWLDVPDPAGALSLRGTIECGVIAMLSNWNKAPIDPPSPGWLGLHSDRERVRRSGLWNNHYVDQPYGPAFFAALEACLATPVPAPG